MIELQLLFAIVLFLKTLHVITTESLEHKVYSSNHINKTSHIKYCKQRSHTKTKKISKMLIFAEIKRWSGDAIVLGKLLVQGRATNLDYSRARAFWRVVGAVGIVWLSFSHLSFSLLSPSLCETVQYRLKYCFKGSLKPNQPTNPLL